MTKTSSESRRRESRAARKGKWSPRGTGTTVLTYPCPSQPCFGGSKERARVTGRAGENSQHSAEMGGSSPWTRPSAPGCGDTLKVLAGDQRPIQGGIVLEDGSGVAIDWVTGRTPPHGDGSMYSQFQRKGKKDLRLPIRALPSVIVDTEKVLREGDGSVKLVVGKTARGWKGVRPGVAPQKLDGECR